MQVGDTVKYFNADIWKKSTVDVWYIISVYGDQVEICRTKDGRCSIVALKKYVKIIDRQG